MLKRFLFGGALLMSLAAMAHAAEGLSSMKKRAVADVEARAKLAQQINDSLFSFSELGYQELETARYIAALLEKNGFTVERGVAGMPSAWVARWTHGQGGPVIALGSDVDGIPKASQKPGIPWREPLDRRRAGARRGTQLRTGREHRRGAGSAGRDAPRECRRHFGVVARHRRRAARRQGVLRARRCFQGRRCRHLHARRRQPERLLGPASWHGPRVHRVHFLRRGRAFGHGAVARPQCARCGRADEHGVGQAARASASGTALALRDHGWRRSTERRAVRRFGLVLLPRADVRRDREEPAASATSWPMRPRR